MSTIVSKEFYTLSEIQELFRISQPTAIRLVHSEGFPKLTAVGKRLLVPREALKQWCIKIDYNMPKIPKLTIPRIPLMGYATGGIPNYGELFMAREGGITEMIGSFGNHTGVANNEQIVQGIASGVADANGEQNAILREQNSLLRRILEKDTTVSAVLSTTDIIGGISRKNRRDGKTIIPVGV